MSDPIVVVGASLAGVRAAEGLRLGGFDGPLVVVGAERHRPYDRPPLSKQVLDGTADSDDSVAALTELRITDDLGIIWRLGTSAVALDIDRRRFHLSDADDLGFDRAVLATGAVPRTLRGFEHREGVHVVRTLDDGLALRRALEAQPKVVLIGAGFIGLEVAASCRARGLEVTVLEAQPVPLAHILGPLVGAAIADMHRRAGVELRLGVTVRGPATAGADAGVGGGQGVGVGPVGGVVLDSGEVVAADLVIVGVGVVPATAWLEGSGIDLDRGIVCDNRLRVLAGGRPVPGLAAAGDVARWPAPGSVTPIRIEHWTNAADQGLAAARVLLEPHDAPPFGPVPYVWSDQYATKLQLIGRPSARDDAQVLEGTPGEGKWLVAYGRHGRLTAALGAGRPARVMKLRRSLAEGAAFPVLGHE